MLSDTPPFSENLISSEQNENDIKDKAKLLDYFSSILERPSPKKEVVESVDLHSVYQELTEIKNEVKKESRLVKSAFNEFKSVFKVLTDDNALLKDELKNKNFQMKKQEEKFIKNYALSLIEYRDYLGLSLKSMQENNKPRRFNQLFKKKNTLSSFIEGQEMLISRFDNILASLKVSSIIVMDTAFNETQMRAIEIRSNKNKEDGYVLEEHRTGYVLNNKILRLAEVTVNKWGNE